MSCHFLAGEHPARSLALADGARRAVRQRVTMARAAAAEMMPFDYPGKPFTHGRALDIDHLPHGKNIDFDLSTGFQPVAFARAQPEFPQTAAGRRAGLGVMAGQGLADPAGPARAYRHLHG